MKKALLAILVLCTIYSCNKNSTEPAIPESPDYLVFGQFAGGMSAEASQLFRVDLSTFEQDIVTDFFPRLDYDFEAEITMSQADWNNARQLIDLLPQSLIETESNTYGCPDCADQGGYFLEFGNNDQSKKVLLDINDTPDQTQDIVAFKNAMATLLLLWDN